MRKKGRNRAQLDSHWLSRLERARYEVDRARRQYDAVEPENRLVTRTLEHAWEAQLRSLQQLEQEYHRAQQNRGRSLSALERDQIRQSPRTCQRSGRQRRPPIQIANRFYDNGPEFISKPLDLWAYWNGVKLDFSRPGKPTDNAFIESFNGKFRQECLNENWFLSLEDAQERVDACMCWQIRPRRLASSQNLQRNEARSNKCKLN
jgi:transposase InsO family protein